MDNISTKNRKARKNHKCSYCGSNIFKGEIYENQVNTDGGTLWEWKSCQHCQDIVDQMFKAGWDDGEGLNDEHFREFILENDIEFKKR